MGEPRGGKLAGATVTGAAEDPSGPDDPSDPDDPSVVGGVDVPEAVHYDDFPMLEDGIGLVRSFLDDFSSPSAAQRDRDGGFFASVDKTAYVRAANPAADTGLRPVAVSMPVSISATRRRPACWP